MIHFGVIKHHNKHLMDGLVLQKSRHFHARINNADNRLILLKLVQMAKVLIKRHVKLTAGATPYDSAYFSYFKKRKRQQLLLNQGW